MARPLAMDHLLNWFLQCRNRKELCPRHPTGITLHAWFQHSIISYLVIFIQLSENAPFTHTHTLLYLVVWTESLPAARSWMKLFDDDTHRFVSRRQGSASNPSLLWFTPTTEKNNTRRNSKPLIMLQISLSTLFTLLTFFNLFPFPLFFPKDSE